MSLKMKVEVRCMNITVIFYFLQPKKKALEMWKKSVEFGQKSETINRKIQEQQYVE